MRVKLYMCGGEADRLLCQFPLGLASLKANCPGDIQIVKRREDLVDCDLIGLSSPAWGVREARDIASSTDIPVVLGGQASLWPGVSELPFRHVVVGEGEVAFGRILRGEVPKEQKIVPAEPVPNLDVLAFAERGECGTQVPIVTSRGCPHRCRFCSSRAFWGAPRYQSPERFMEEVSWLLSKHHSMTTLRIMDDLFVTGDGRFDRIHTLWMRAGFHKRLRLRSFVRSSRFDYGLAVMMREMGFFRVWFGAESGSDRLLRAIGKGATVEQHQATVDAAIRAGLEVSASFMHGLPGETADDRAQTAAFLERNRGKLRVEGSYRFKAFPGTCYYAGEDLLACDMRVR